MSTRSIIGCVCFYYRITLVKCVIYVRLTISNFISSSAFLCSSFHEKIDFLFSNGLKGLSRDVKFGTNLIYWFFEPKNDLNSSRCLGIGTSTSLMALVLSIREGFLIWRF